MNNEMLFKDIAEECRKKEFFSESEDPKSEYSRFQKTAAHYELQNYDSVNMIGIEFHIEKKGFDETDYKAKKEKMYLLEGSCSIQLSYAGETPIYPHFLAFCRTLKI